MADGYFSVDKYAANREALQLFLDMKVKLLTPRNSSRDTGNSAAVLVAPATVTPTKVILFPLG